MIEYQLKSTNLMEPFLLEFNFRREKNKQKKTMMPVPELALKSADFTVH